MILHWHSEYLTEHQELEIPAYVRDWQAFAMERIPEQVIELLDSEPTYKEICEIRRNPRVYIIYREA